tara:strand:+ start:138 stop:389 length:252 start_codon:yes stop_codon:yes gene_type:complete
MLLLIQLKKKGNKMTIKLDLTLKELNIVVDALDTELDIQKQFIGDKHEDEYDRQLYEETETLLKKLDKIFINSKLFKKVMEKD